MYTKIILTKSFLLLHFYLHYRNKINYTISHARKFYTYTQAHNLIYISTLFSLVSFYLTTLLFVNIRHNIISCHVPRYTEVSTSKEVYYVHLFGERPKIETT